MHLLKLLTTCEYPKPEWEQHERVYAIIGLEYKHWITITRFIELDNTSLIPEDNFIITSSSLLPIVLSLSPPESVVGFAHTHPEEFPMPSEDDINGIFGDFFGLVLSGDKSTWYNNSGIIIPE